MERRDTTGQLNVRIDWYGRVRRDSIPTRISTEVVAITVVFLNYEDEMSNRVSGVRGGRCRLACQAEKQEQRKDQRRLAWRPRHASRYEMMLITSQLRALSSSIYPQGCMQGPPSLGSGVAEERRDLIDDILGKARQSTPVMSSRVDRKEL